MYHMYAHLSIHIDDGAGEREKEGEGGGGGWLIWEKEKWRSGAIMNKFVSYEVCKYPSTYNCLDTISVLHFQ